MFVTCEQMRTLEEAEFARGTTAESLMERAGLGMAQALCQFFPEPGRLLIAGGKGHNAGDALVAARLLLDQGWAVSVRFVCAVDALKPLTASKWECIRDRVTLESWGAPAPRGRGKLVVMDALLGIGAGGPMRGDVRDACRAVNRMRNDGCAKTIAIDIPTGLHGDDGSSDPDAVIADFTFTVAAVKRGLINDAAINHVGRLVRIPLPELEPQDDGTSPRLADAECARSLLVRRTFDMHKGTAGRVGIVAGSVGMLGAARLAATAALHAGAGLVTLFAPESVWSQLAIACAPEIMVRAMNDLSELRAFHFDAIGIGPGLGRSLADEALVQLIVSCPTAMVVDADALNALARKGVGHLAGVTHARLLTPHPGEMQRLQQSAGRSRADQTAAFAEAFPVTLLLKGARTIVASAGAPLTYNSTGNPGMASGGMGDVLTGVCSALIAQGLSTHDAGVLGSWLTGRAAEIAVRDDRQSFESLTASAVIRNLGAAFESCRNG